MRPRRPSRLQATLRLRQGAGRRGDGARVHRLKRKPTSAVPTAERLPRCALSSPEPPCGAGALLRLRPARLAACCTFTCPKSHLWGQAKVQIRIL